ncbi:nuclear transport factor 2 family protein [Novosphingobium cyanobacteriorum]|uniref:Nuclear transport factor 2 family protein n=1 Tax=Novosphingobium cyanobacteriorum TaxID=3024215 RepID=A0ABT6CDJ3_9SPHN|nr:nuclear transport factor 2 family protein [Novosphingobium cyanobacteriorum]MDF8332005.1 nuclear transport factor 2 family protein [Novosphingobium cyanobacteriorum]
MSIDLPDPIARYFAADRRGSAASLATCFSPDAIVIDEGNTYAGLDAIRQWMTNASTQYTYTVEPFALAHHDDRIVVTSHLAGNFPGSPVDLRYRFIIEGDRIARLEIVA